MARREAGAILRTCDDAYRAEFKRGIAIKDTPAGVAWYTSTRIGVDAKPVLDAFNLADSFFTAKDEPPSISGWTDDATATIADIARWYEVTAPRAGGDANADAAAQRKVLADLSKQDKAVQAVAAGH